MMPKKRLLIVAMISVLAVLVSHVADAQTPDGETPANEGVCDELIGFTPGLYGLCVAFCEAQDCEATFDPATNEVTFDPGCRPSNPKLLENYNKRRGPDDPPMPCLNVVENECPCWTDEELATIADGSIVYCGSVGGLEAGIFGVDLVSGENDIADVDGLIGGGFRCTYIEWSPLLVVRFFVLISEAEFEVCTASIFEECADRGL